MPAPSAITAIRTSLRIVFCAHEMLTAGASMPATTKYPDLINKIRFFHTALWPKI
jgi:hypothetical protein